MQLLYATAALNGPCLMNRALNGPDARNEKSVRTGGAAHVGGRDGLNLLAQLVEKHRVQDGALGLAADLSHRLRSGGQ